MVEDPFFKIVYVNIKFHLVSKSPVFHSRHQSTTCMLLVEPHGTTSCAIVNVLICVDIQEVEDPALEAVTEESSDGRKQ